MITTLTGQEIPSGVINVPEYVQRHVQISNDCFFEFNNANSPTEKMEAVAKDIYNTAYPAVAFQTTPNGEVPNWPGAAVWQRLNSQFMGLWIIHIPLQGEEKDLRIFFFEQDSYLLIIWPWGTVVPLSLK
jgi:hypothetical protein